MAGECSVEGKTFLITGAASGLGELYAETFLREGAKHVAIVDVADKVGIALTARLNATYAGRVTFTRCDVSKEVDIASTFEEITTRLGQLDVVINNAGIMVDTPAMWRTASDVNWQGVVSFTMKAVKHMRRDEGGAGGTVINISSTLGLTKMRALPIYSGSKMAVLHFTHCIAADPFYEQTGVRMLTVAPGPTKTPLLEGLDKRGYDEITSAELHEIEKVGKHGEHDYQKPSSAAVVLLHVYRHGTNGSTWLTIHDQPAQDITPFLNKVFTDLEKIIAG